MHNHDLGFTVYVIDFRYFGMMTYISTAADFFFPGNFWQGGSTYSVYLFDTYFFPYDYAINSYPWVRSELKDTESVFL